MARIMDALELCKESGREERDAGRSSNPADREASMSSFKRRLRHRGAVMVEYALLVSFVAIPTVIGVSAGAVLLTQNYVAQRTGILTATP